jgi:pyruvate/2-oxoglutarate dehydrogenase complex dihydrolipoamide dehydrogenase (E3) component
MRSSISEDRRLRFRTHSTQYPRLRSGSVPLTHDFWWDEFPAEHKARHVRVELKSGRHGVWAIGEVAGSPQFTHISVDDFRVVHANLTGGNRVITGRQVPYCLFTDPELARIGLNETEAQAQGIPYDGRDVRKSPSSDDSVPTAATIPIVATCSR